MDDYVAEQLKFVKNYGVSKVKILSLFLSSYFMFHWKLIRGKDTSRLHSSA